MKTVLETIQSGTGYFEKHGVESARLNMEHLLALVLGCERMQLYLDFDRPMGEAELAPLRELVKRRAGGEPLQHLLGTVEFFGREFKCDGRALVPRPETEELVAKVLERFDDVEGDARVLDMGSGSGVIGLTLACERPGFEVWLADVSVDALALARENMTRVGLGEEEGNARLVESDLFSGVEGEFDLIVANLPYVPDSDKEKLSREVLRDPATALFGGERGTEVIERFLRECSGYLRDGARLALEIGLGQADFLRGAVKKAGFCDVEIEEDSSGRERFVFAVKTGG